MRVALALLVCNEEVVIERTVRATVAAMARAGAPDTRAILIIVESLLLCAALLSKRQLALDDRQFL